MTKHFDWPIRVYYEDTDAGGVVYHSRYLNFMERARSEWLRALGFEQDRLAREAGVLFAVHRIEADFLSPARFNEALVVRSRLLELRRASMAFEHEIRRVEDASLLCSARAKLACIDAARFRPRAIPQTVIDEIKHGL